MTGSRPFGGRWVLVGALALCLASVLAHEVVSRRAYDESVTQIAVVTENTIPSLLHLGEVRRAVYSVGRDLVLHRHDEVSLRQRLQESWPVIDAHMQAYMALPELPGEGATRRHLLVSLARLRSAEERLFTGSRVDVEHEVLADASEVHALLDVLVTENARASAEAADQVALAHARASSLSILLVAAMLGVFSLAGLAAWRLMTRLEERAVRRMDELEAFAGRVAHDLKSPLHPALLTVALLRREALSEAGAASVDRLERSLHRAAGLVDGLLAFARSGAEPAADARADVARVLDDLTPALRQLAEAEHAELTLDATTGLEVAAEPAVVGSIAENLARNALLYLGPAERREVRVSARADGATCRLEVVDTGPGIPADLLRRLFQPFERGSDRPGGSGLGLATVKRLVDAHGGAVDVTSRLGAGTTFVVRLPLAGAAASAVSAAGAAR